MKHFSQISKWVLGLFIVMMVLAACGGEPTPQPDLTDKTAPRLSSSLPATGASAVPINAKIALTFSEAMDEDSLELSSNPSITLGTATWNAASTSVAFENDILSASRSYTLSIKAKDVSGNTLVQTTLTFTTSNSADTTAPSTPRGLVATPANGQVTLTWQANPEADIAGYTLYMGTAENALESRDFLITNSTTIKNLTNGTPYFFALDAVDAANNHSEQTSPVFATPSSSATDTTPPTIQSSNPNDGATDVSPRATSIRVQFSEPMDKASLEFTITPRFGAADEAFNIVWSDNDTIVTLQPSLSNVVAEDTTFTLSVNAKDRAGNALSGDKEITFKTGFDVPFLVSSTPADGATNVAIDSISEPFIFITLTFSEPVEATGFMFDESIFSQSCEGATFPPDVVTIILACYVADGNTYTLTFSGQDFEGHKFASSISFSTIPDTVPPSVRSTFPKDSDVNVSLSERIIINFNDEMDEASTLAAISSSPDVGCTWILSKAKDALECSPANLLGNTTYTITVAETAKDTSGKNLVGAGACRGTPPCAYEFMFSTIVTATTGTLKVNISGAPTNLAKVRVTGPNGYSSGNLGSSATLSDLEPGTYTITAQGFGTGQLGKPTCKSYIPTVPSQTATVTAGQTLSASVTYEVESCFIDEP